MSIFSLIKGWTLAIVTLLPLTVIGSTESYTIEEGQIPWRDRAEGDRIFILGTVPESLRGRGPFERQSCGNRALTIPQTDEAALIGVESNTDIHAFREGYPQLVDTEERFTVHVEQSSQRFFYTVISLKNPPPRIQGGKEGVPPLSSGLIYLGPDKVSNRRLPESEQPTAFSPPESPAQLHVYLLMGQSNMLGRDTSGMQSLPLNSLIGNLNRNGEWKLAREPLSPIGSGVGPGLSFADTMLKNLPEGTRIGLVQCAVGGTPLSRWEKGADLYQNALQKAKEAQRSGTLKGILWHQGEQDTVAGSDAKAYERRVAEMLTNFRADLGLPELPVVIGQIGEFLATPGAAGIRGAIARVPEKLPCVGLADSAGLKDQGDRIHFSSIAQTEFGQRFAKKMLELQAKP